MGSHGVDHPGAAAQPRLKGASVMTTRREWIRRLWSTLRPARSDRDLEGELRLHVQLAAEDRRRRGASRESAAHTAAIEAGGIAHAMEALRDQRGLPRLDDLLRDVRHACRLLRRSPLFAAVAVASLALGVGANSAMFSLADELILRPLPVRDPGAIVTVSAAALDQGSGGRLSYPNYRDLRRTSQSFDGLVAEDVTAASFARSRDAVRDMRIGMLVSENFFDVLGVSAALGRTFTAGEGRVPGRDAVVVLSHDFWKDALGADPSVLDAVVWMNGIDFRVIGVAPASFTGVEPPLRPAFYVPAVMAQRLGASAENMLERRDARTFSIKGRLRHGVSIARARAELTTIWLSLAQQYPDANRYRAIAVRTELDERLRDDPWDTVTIAILMALAAIVLAIASANVANLMLGRGRARSREMAVRLALGVSRPRLLRQLLTESLVLALMGLGLGLAVAYGGIRFLQTLPTGRQVVIAPQLDRRVLVFSLLVAAVSAVLCGIAPARQSLNTDVAPGLRSGELTGKPRRRAVGPTLLVIAQIALSMVLLVATGMLLDGFQKALTLDPGFRTDHLIMLSSDTSVVRYTPAQTHAFYRDLVRRARALPGVASAALTSSVPFKVGDWRSEAVVPEGYEFPHGEDRATTSAAIVDERYFDTMQIKVVRGRGFTADDNRGSRGVAVVNEKFAETYWPHANPVGKRLRLADTAGAWLDVVGVTTTGKYTWIAEAPMPFLYLPFAQHEQPDMSLLVETRQADAAGLATPLREIVRSLDVNQPVFDVQTFAGLYHERAIAVPLMIMQVVGTMGLLGLSLALVGLYALVAYSVARRTREIGVRMAIGAGKSDVLRMVLRQGLTLALAGIAVGGVASVAFARLLTAALVGVGTPSPATYVAVPVLLVGLTIGASYFPARRASRLDPLIALRDE
jgi:putative ABC transport system permease protein